MAIVNGKNGTSVASGSNPFPVQQQGKATYRAAVTASFAAAASTAPFFVIEGSGSKTLIVQRVRITGLTLTAVEYLELTARKYSTASTGGTATTLAQVPMDSSLAAATANVCKVFTAAPTPGTLVGTIAALRILGQAATAAASGLPVSIDFDFRNMGSENTGVYLRGTAQGLGIGFAVAPATAVTLCVEVEWTEE